MLPKKASAGENSMPKLTARPMLQDLVKSAMAASAHRVNVSQEAALQVVKVAGEKCAEHDMPMSECAHMHKTEKKASEQKVEKLASALDFLADKIKGAADLAGPYHLSEHLVTSPPGVSHATAAGQLPDHKGQGVHVVPMHTGSEKGLPTEHGTTKNETNLNHAPAEHQKQIEKNYGGKTASPLELIRSKVAADEHEKKETEGLEVAKKGLEEAEKAHKSEPENKKEASLAEYISGRVSKVAEDAISPAHISAGAAVPPATSEGGEKAKQQPAGGAPQGPTGHVMSNKGAIDLKRGEAYANRKEDLKKYFAEPAMSADHDKVLQVAFSHTPQAGPKIASAEGAEPQPPPAGVSVKTAAASALLSKLAASIEAEKNKESGARA
jgi:hypothetical protein